ncbi:MAG TPA: TIGR00730 family Rossman fold protein, partial [Ignavibacteria bacterium]|nr:TIGR00730 family Rossman fold protein [Ignavibacteria bacterium]
MKKICVFCGSSFGNNKSYSDTANLLGNLIAKKNIELVYGGASVGLMGEIASAVLKAGGKVTGVIPKQLLEKEVAHTGLNDLRIVGSMHERKSLMADLSDGFIAMPGGFGTLEEVFEVVAWGQLNFHNKPLGLLNVNGYYNNLIKFLDHSVNENFIKPEHREMILVNNDPEAMITQLQNYIPPKVDKADWILEMLNKQKPA